MTNIDLTVPEGATDTEAALIKALGRLIRRRPKTGTLIGIRDAGGLLITHANVALEAEKSRTLIGFENCRYKAVRKRITAAMHAEVAEMSGIGAKDGRSSTSREIIQALRDRIVDLTFEKEALASSANVALNVADAMQKKLRQAERIAERANAKVEALQVQLDRRAGRPVVADIAGGRRS